LSAVFPAGRGRPHELSGGRALVAPEIHPLRAEAVGRLPSAAAVAAERKIDPGPRARRDCARQVCGHRRVDFGEKRFSVAISSPRQWPRLSQSQPSRGGWPPRRGYCSALKSDFGRDRKNLSQRCAQAINKFSFLGGASPPKQVLAPTGRNSFPGPPTTCSSCFLRERRSSRGLRAHALAL
jgi:hypothetical protein